ncbi:MAG: hypothetical protein CL610_19960 [Anaerolineaceae bacterium]|nr:hypothetical protein [Anaerolineaceae bacterium]
MLFFSLVSKEYLEHLNVYPLFQLLGIPAIVLRVHSYATIMHWAGFGALKNLKANRTLRFRWASVSIPIPLFVLLNRVRKE